MRFFYLKSLMGALLIVIIVFSGGSLYLSKKRVEYRNQLENIINNVYLEGRDAIGAFWYENNDSIEIEKVSDYSSDFPSLSVSHGELTLWHCDNWNNSIILGKLLHSGDYKWYDLKDCSTTFAPFLIIVKKTERGYDIIGEFIVGIGLSDLYPDDLITHEPYLIQGWDLNLSERSWVRNPSKDKIGYKYKIKTDMVKSYFQELFENKYSGVTIRKDGYKNIKYDKLDDLVSQGICKKDSSFYFRVNKYFELKPDNDLITMGTYPTLSNCGSFGNQIQTVFTRTVISSYSIQENSGLLDSECNKITIFLIIILEAFYGLLIIALHKRYKRNKYIYNDCIK